MTVVVNGVRASYAPGTTLAAVVADVAGAGAGIAVAVNGEVVRRREWDAKSLHDDDRVEVLAAVQGG